MLFPEEGLWETPSRLLQRAGLNVELKVVPEADTEVWSFLGAGNGEEVEGGGYWLYKI